MIFDSSTQAKCERVLRWLSEGKPMPPMQTSTIPANPAVNQQGAPVQNMPPQQPGQYQPPQLPVPQVQMPQNQLPQGYQQPQQQFAPQYQQPQGVPMQPQGGYAGQTVQNSAPIHPSQQVPQQPQQPQQQYAPQAPPVQSVPVQPQQALQHPANLAAAPQGPTGVSTKVGVPDIPEWMKVDKSELGTANMTQYVVPPRLKIVQGQSSIELKQMHPESCVIATSSGNPTPRRVTNPLMRGQDGRLIVDTFQVVPVFFYPEFTLQNPAGLGMPFLRDRSTDERGKLAQICRGDFKKRQLPLPEDPTKQMKFVEIMNFIVAIYSKPEFEEFFLMSFQRAEFGKGRLWCEAIRYPKNVPCYAQLFEVGVGARAKDQNNWYGYDVKPVIDPQTNKLQFLTDPAWFEYYRSQFLDLQQKMEEGAIVADYESESETVADPNVIDTTATQVGGAGGTTF